MKAVVDTNVVAYLLLGTERYADEALDCLTRVTRPMAPSHWEAEVTNVLWVAVRTGALPPDEAPHRLTWARRLRIESMATATLAHSALLRSIDSGIAVYDTLFVELAIRSACPLITFDKAALKAFPDVATLPKNFPPGRAR